MLTEICSYLKNWFDFNQPKYIGDFEIKDGVIKTLSGNDMGILPGQYYRIIGSVFNDGVHQYPAEADEDPDESQDEPEENHENSEDPENPVQPSETDNQDEEQEEQDILIDETFDGAVWLMAVPKDMISLLKDISDWQEKYGGIDSENMSPFTSESFAGYSYSKSQGGSGNGYGDGSSVSWQSAFRSRLQRWKKL